MSLISYANRVVVSTSTTGTGTITLGAVVLDNFGIENLVDGATYKYLLKASDGGAEVGRGVYTASGTTLTRDVVEDSSNSDNLITLPAGTHRVEIVVTKQDLENFDSIYNASNFSVRNDNISTQNIAPAIWTKLDNNSLVSEERDVGGVWNNSTSTFTADRAGEWYFYGSVLILTLPDGVRLLSAPYKNGSIYNIGSSLPASASGGAVGTISGNMFLDVNDTVEFYVNHAHTVSQATWPDPAWVYFGGRFLGA